MAKTRRTRHNRRHGGKTLQVSKAKKEAFKARKKADKEEEKRTDKLLTKAELADLNAARKSADRRIKLEKIREKAQDAQWKLEEIENKARRKKEAEEFKYNNLAKREFQKDPLLKKKAKAEAEKDPDYIWGGVKERKEMVQYYLDGFWIMLGEAKRDALVAQAKEKAEAKAKNKTKKSRIINLSLLAIYKHSDL